MSFSNIICPYCKHTTNIEGKRIKCVNCNSEFISVSSTLMISPYSDVPEYITIENENGSEDAEIIKHLFFTNGKEYIVYTKNERDARGIAVYTARVNRSGTTPVITGVVGDEYNYVLSIVNRLSHPN